MSETSLRKPGTLLIFGGTGEAAALARMAKAQFGESLRVVLSLAGRTQMPRETGVETRIGGFGGVEGLGDYLAAENVRLVVDALHPFATMMARHVVEACVAAGVPRLAFRRAPWRPQTGDRWIDAADADAAARAVIESGAKRVFFAAGAKDMAAFADLPKIWFLVRLVEPRAEELPLARYGLIFARGPFEEAADARLLARHDIQLVVAKNGGGSGAYAKIDAARARHLPVVMIAPPAPPPGEIVAEAEDILVWIGRHL